MKTVVHVLSSETTLCGSLTGDPLRWPAGHRWAFYGQPHHVTCQACRDEAERRWGTQPGEKTWAEGAAEVLPGLVASRTQRGDEG